jgi:hypothetical protein
MTKESLIQRHIGSSTATKPVNAPVGSTYYEYDTNDTYITIDSGSTWVVKDSKSTKRIKVTTTVSAAAAYTSGDIIANSAVASTATTWDFLNVAGYNGGGGRIVQAQIETNANVCSATPTLYLFTTSAPASAILDNIACDAPKPADVSTGVYLGKIDFPVVAGVYTTSTDANSMLFSTASSLPFYFLTASTEDDLHAIVMTNTGATFASKEIAITLWVKRD